MSIKSNRKAAVKAASRFSEKVSESLNDLSLSSIMAQLFACQPSGCSGAYEFKWNYLRSEIATKFCGDGTDPSEKRDRAVAKMLQSEKTCAEINAGGLKPFENDTAIILRAQALIGMVLGDVSEVGSVMENHFSFTSGATVCRTRRFGDPYFKYDSARTLSVTRNALPYAKLLIASTPLWDQEIEIVSGNVVFTVPKDSDIDRAACKEPALNQLLQTCVGSYMRKRLKKFGIDLNDQSRNQSLARKGSKTGRFATLDLKSASDTISQRCIHELFSTRWVKFLDDLRSPSGLLPDGKSVIWEKHSTMGNGYTFELESLIFWALTRATIDVTCYFRHLNNKRKSLPATFVSVYGDDIICPSHYFTAVSTTLVSFGFTVNEKKSFHEGPFRESCGGHYFNGHDVKPFYIRKPIDSPERVIWLLNSLRRWASDDDGMCDPSVYQLWLTLRRAFVPSEFLGGQNLASISEVVSPCAPRYSLLWVKPNKPIDGVRALLRWFQYNPVQEDKDSIRITYHSRKERYHDRNRPASSRPVNFNQLVDLGARERLRTKRYVPTLVETSLFPQETVNY